MPDTKPALLTPERLVAIEQTQALDGEDCHCAHCRAVDDLLAHIRALDARAAAMRAVLDAEIARFDAMGERGKSPTWREVLEEVNDALERITMVLEGATDA